MIKNWSFFALMVSGSAFWASVESVRGQTVERDTTITGPRGRTVQRQVEIQRRPGDDRSAGSDQASRGNLRSTGSNPAFTGRGTSQRRTSVRTRPGGRGFRGRWLWARPCRLSGLDCWPPRC